MNTLSEIESLTRAYSAERSNLSDIVGELNDRIEELKRSRMKAIKIAVNRAAEAKAALQSAIDDSRGLFTRPRTMLFHGVNVGLRKGPGGIEWDDDTTVCALIEKHFPKSQAELLIKTTKKPIAKALEDLDVADLKRIGCRVAKTDDQIVIKPADSAIDKIVDALLIDAVEQAESQEAA